MRKQGHITIKGIVQGVGFRPFVYAHASALGIVGQVQNTGSEVHIDAFGDRFEEFVSVIATGPPLSVIDSVEVTDCAGSPPASFTISPSEDGGRTGLIPPDIATCHECVRDILTQGSRYEGYFATSCVNCGPRYSIIRALPYDRERTAMDEFPPCQECTAEYTNPSCRRHHAQTIACEQCGPAVTLHRRDGEPVRTPDPIRETAALLDSGALVAIRGMGGFHLACTGNRAAELKKRLGRTEQPFAIMANLETIRSLTRISPEQEEILHSPASPILILDKKDPAAYPDISNLHTIGCMLPYTGLHHLLFAALRSPLLIMTSANAPGYPMITSFEQAREKLAHVVDAYLTHNRDIVSRCDDSVVRGRHIIRLSRGYAPRRIRIDLGRDAILGVGPELNSTMSIYTDSFCVTSPHIGNVRNPGTYAYLQETIDRLMTLLKPEIRIIAHDLHPQFLSTRLAQELAETFGAELVPVQHHMAHIAATCQEECIGIALDGVGYGSDGTAWGGEIFSGTVPHLRRCGHLMPVPMPGGDLAASAPERMLFGILPDDRTRELLSTRGWSGTELDVIEQQVKRKVNTSMTTSTGRVLDAVSALLGICRKKTYDGEPAMKLESAAWNVTPDDWDIPVTSRDGCLVLDTPGLVKRARDEYLKDDSTPGIRKIASSFQYNLARGIAEMAIHSAHDTGTSRIALSGGVVYNEQIRETIREKISAAGCSLLTSTELPLGDGCISFGQCVWAGLLKKEDR